jgi:hypothetical protein
LSVEHLDGDRDVDVHRRADRDHVVAYAKTIRRCLAGPLVAEVGLGSAPPLRASRLRSNAETPSGGLSKPSLSTTSAAVYQARRRSVLGRRRNLALGNLNLLGIDGGAV